MKKLKMYIALICCLAMLNISCSAEILPPHFEVSTTADKVSPGDELFLLVNLKDNAGFGAIQFCITYDKDKLLLESSSLGELIPNSAITSINTDITGEVNFSVISLQEITESGTILVSKFKAKENGTAKFDFKLLAYADSNGTSLNSTVSDAEIVIGSEESPKEPEAEKPEVIPPEVIPPKDNPPTDTPSDEAPPVIEDTETEDTETEENDRPAGSGTIVSGGSGGGNKKPVKTEDETKTDVAEKPKESKQTDFADVTQTHWAYNQISKVVELGLFSGTGEDAFSPDSPMTRAMFVTVLHRYAGSPEAEKAEFSDVGESWYTNAVFWAAQNGIASGTGENKFSPDDYITRGQIATILCRYKNGKSMDVNSVNTFKDVAKIPDWGKEPVAWAIEQGLIMGREGGFVAFDDNATRAETAVIFTRFLNVR